MCQAFEGEQRFMMAMEKAVRRRGYDAQKAGVPMEDNPERDHALEEYSDKIQWEMGWRIAANGEALW